jgi:hypothetical protein
MPQNWCAACSGSCRRKIPRRVCCSKYPASSARVWPGPAAIIAGAFCGFAMGATATAIANMQALTRRHGPAPQAFVVVPLVGAFFIDLMNLAVLTFFLLPGFIIRG